MFLKSVEFFQILLCVGDFFSGDGTDWESYKTGKQTGDHEGHLVLFALGYP